MRIYTDESSMINLEWMLEIVVSDFNLYLVISHVS